MLGLRVITAAVLAAIILPTLLIGGVKAISVLVAAFVLVGTWELASKLPGLRSNYSKSSRNTFFSVNTVPFLHLPY